VALLMVLSFVVTLVFLIVGAITHAGALTTVGAVSLIVFVVSLLVLGSQMRGHRDRALPVLAREYGWQFSERDPFALAEAKLPFDVFRQRGVQVRNAAWGTLDGIAIRAFDVRYEVYGGSDVGWQPTNWAFCAQAEIPANCPPLWVVRGHGVSATDERPRVHLESGRFNEEVTLLCADTRFATTIIDQRMMAWLLDSAPSGVRFEVSDRHVLASKDEATEQVGSIVQVVSGLAGFVHHIPPVVRSLYPPSPSSS
jgi:hypothetical protein